MQTRWIGKDKVYEIKDMGFEHLKNSFSFGNKFEKLAFCEEILNRGYQLNQVMKQWYIDNGHEVKLEFENQDKRLQKIISKLKSDK